MESRTHDENDFELIVLYIGTDSYSTFVAWCARLGYGITVCLQLNTDITI
jgi:hypothetical protein